MHNIFYFITKKALQTAKELYVPRTVSTESKNSVSEPFSATKKLKEDNEKKVDAIIAEAAKGGRFKAKDDKEYDFPALSKEQTEALRGVVYADEVKNAAGGSLAHHTDEKDAHRAIQKAKQSVVDAVERLNKDKKPEESQTVEAFVREHKDKCFTEAKEILYQNHDMAPEECRTLFSMGEEDFKKLKEREEQAAGRTLTMEETANTLRTRLRDLINAASGKGALPHYEERRQKYREGLEKDFQNRFGNEPQPKFEDEQKSMMLGKHGKLPMRKMSSGVRVVTNRRSTLYIRVRIT